MTSDIVRRRTVLESDLRRVIVLLLGLVICLLPGTALAQDEAQGILKVSSSVKGAIVHIDYEQAGEAPMTRYVDPGKHTVRVSADGYDPFVRRVPVAPNSTTQIVANLKPGGGTVEFFFRPLGATVEISGTDVGPSPIRLDSVQPGEHSYRVTAPQHIAVVGTFTLGKGGNVLIAGELESSEGVVWIDSDPAVAAVSMDGEDLGTTPLRLTEVASGEHTVLVQAEGLATALRSFDNSDGELAHIEARLGDTGATLSVQSPDEAAEVRLDGERIGTGKKVKVFVERGSYDLSVEAPGHKPLAEEIDVPPLGSVFFKADLVAEGEDGQSALVASKPLLGRWTTWAVAGGVAVGAGAAVTVAVILTRPEESPTGDVVVPLP